MTDRRRRRSRRSPLRTLLRWVFLAFFLVIALFAAVLLTGGTVDITDGSMNPSLGIGDRIIEDRLTYLVRDPQRGDIVQFSAGDGNGSVLIRRIVGLPGETVRIADGQVYINSNKLDESAYMAGSIQYSGTASLPLTLSEDEYFVMADNRSSNFDSRDPTVGNVNKADITGRLWLRIAPKDRFGRVS